MSATGFYIREWYASYYCNKTSQWLYGKLVADPTQIVFKENDSKGEEEAYTPLTLVIPFGKVETIKKMRSTVIFSSLVITLNNSQDIHWFSSFTDRSAVCLTLNHFLRFGLFSKESKDQPMHKESTELGTELLKVAHDSERTLAQAAEKLESQGEQIDNCIAVMYDIEEDLDVSENLIKGLQSWFGQLTTMQKTNDVVDPVVITNKDIPDVHEYEVLYYKMDEDRCPLHSLCDGILRISREALTLTTPLQAVVENYSWSEISRVYAVTPWELHISHFCLGKPDVNYTIISAHIHKFVKRLASRLKDRFEFMESSQSENLCSDLPIKGSTSTQNTSIQERSPTEYKDPMQEQKNASKQLVSDSEVEEVSSILTKIKSMALNINHEETKQNEKLDELTDSVKTATTRVKDQTKQIKKMI